MNKLRYYITLYAIMLLAVLALIVLVATHHPR